ncbi:unnamed protein product [Ostreobium quekettii]|uniref:RING-type domain-containing protein n=1 Tax=Ostreobium quekettii TaxID=121088 RepID=A0A8S1IUI6_9CHLO|nr:unnamed protein product [Ostreobium quekettii]
MADGGELMGLCTSAGGTGDGGGPPIKRLRGGGGGEAGRGCEDEPGLPGPGPNEGEPSHAFASGLVPGGLEAALARRGASMRQEARAAAPQVGRVDLWGEPSTFFDIANEPLDLAEASPSPSDNLQWARKSQRQSRTSSRLPPEGAELLRGRAPESPFGWCSPPPPTLPSSPPSEVFQFPRGLSSPPRVRPVMRPGRGGRAPGPAGDQRFGSWEDILDPEDEFLELGMIQARGGPPRPSRGSGRPSTADAGTSLAEPRSESYPCGFFEPPSSEAGEGSGGFPSMTQRASRGMDSRRTALLEAAREQALQQTRDAIQRHRTQRAQRIRERRSSLREEFGALMNALGILHAPEGGPDRVREGRSSMFSMQEAMMGIARSGLPPHLLFTDRDFTPDDYEWLCRLDEGVENRKGADEDTINKLATVAYADVEVEDAQEDVHEEDEVEEVVVVDEAQGLSDPARRCPICLECFGREDMLRVMPCKHKYHMGCLDKWLKIKATCPICNLNIKGE